MVRKKTHKRNRTHLLTKERERGKRSQRLFRFVLDRNSWWCKCAGRENRRECWRQLRSSKFAYAVLVAFFPSHANEPPSYSPSTHFVKQLAKCVGSASRAAAASRHWLAACFDEKAAPARHVVGDEFDSDFRVGQIKVLNAQPRAAQLDLFDLRAGPAPRNPAAPSNF